MKTSQCLLFLVMLICVPVAAGSLQADGSADATAVLYFAGTHATGTLEGTFTLTGQMTLEEEIVPFSACGWARGEGAGDTATLDAEAWATFAVQGTTEGGRLLSVQGGVTLTSLSAGSSDTSGSGTGTFFATVFFDGRQYHAEGSAQGSATGTFVPPEDPYSMELEGRGTFSLEGTLTLVPTDSDDTSETPARAEDSVASALPWETDSWPEELLAQLLHILSNELQSDIAP